METLRCVAVTARRLASAPRYVVGLARTTSRIATANTRFGVAKLSNSAAPVGRFAGKVTIVTGGGSGIGAGITATFVREGGAVLFSGLPHEHSSGTSLAARLTAASRSGGRAAYRTADMRVEDELLQLVTTAVSTFGRLDCVVNNAGFHPPITPIDEMDTRGLHAVLAVNLVGPWILCKAALPHLRATGGSIVNVASVSGHFGQIGSAGYCASKAGLVGMTKGLAIDEAIHGVRANVVSPGNTWTPAWEAQAAGNADDVQEGIDAQPLGRMATPDEIGEVVLHLATATYTTGHEYLCTGGAELGYGTKNRRVPGGSGTAQ